MDTNCNPRHHQGAIPYNTGAQVCHSAGEACCRVLEYTGYRMNNRGSLYKTKDR
jgi:hypothetical protein